MTYNTVIPFEQVAISSLERAECGSGDLGEASTVLGRRSGDARL
jgi:hypothetical protein